MDVVWRMAASVVIVTTDPAPAMATRRRLQDRSAAVSRGQWRERRRMGRSVQDLARDQIAGPFPCPLLGDAPEVDSNDVRLRRRGDP